MTTFLASYSSQARISLSLHPRTLGAHGDDHSVLTHRVELLWALLDLLNVIRGKERSGCVVRFYVYFPCWLAGWCHCHHPVTSECNLPIASPLCAHPLQRASVLLASCQRFCRQHHPNPCGCLVFLWLPLALPVTLWLLLFAITCLLYFCCCMWHLRSLCCSVFLLVVLTECPAMVWSHCRLWVQPQLADSLTGNRELLALTNLYFLILHIADLLIIGNSSVSPVCPGSSWPWSVLAHEDTGVHGKTY